MRPRAVVASILACLAVFLASVSAKAEERKGGVSLSEAGLITFGVGYAWSAGTGAIYRDRNERVLPMMFVPVAGPIAAVRSDSFDGRYTLTGRAIEATHANSCSGDGVICAGVLPFLPFAIVEYLMIYGASAAQATGLVMALVGTLKDAPASDRDRMSRASKPAPTRPRIALSPGAPGGVGLSLSVTQW